MKTYSDWAASRLPLDKFVSVGDVVDEAMVEYFLEVLPPAFMSYNLIQIGEPNSHIGNRPTFATISRTAQGWVYGGNCFLGSDIPQGQIVVCA